MERQQHDLGRLLEMADLYVQAPGYGGLGVFGNKKWSGAGDKG